MAAILFKAVCYEPCKAIGKCCEGCCECLGECCESCCACLAGCCECFDDCSQQCGKVFSSPFSFCVFITAALNLVIVLFAVASLASGGGGNCPTSVTVYLLINVGWAVINVAFAVYLFRRINDMDEKALAEFRGQESRAETKKLNDNVLHFFMYDPWFALYLVAFIVMLVLPSLAMDAAGNCPKSSLGAATYITSVLVYVFMFVGTLILASYVLLPLFKEMADGCCIWCIPCLWPCLFIGCFAKMWSDAESQFFKENPQTRVQKAPVQVVTQPAAAAQHYDAAPPQYGGPMQPPAYGAPVHYAPVAVAPVVSSSMASATTAETHYIAPQPQYGYVPSSVGAPVAAAPVNPAAIRPGEFVVHSQPAAAAPLAAAHSAAAAPAAPETESTTTKAVGAAKAFGMGALSFAARKMQELDQKVNQPEGGGAAAAEGASTAEGRRT